MMRSFLTLSLAVLCLLGLTATQATALVIASDCTSDADCQDDWHCVMDDCPDLPCDEPDDPGCQCAGWCEPISDEKSGDPWTPENQCETDADCAEGFDCVEEEGWAAPNTTVTEVPMEAPCREGDDCGDEDGGDENADPPVEEPKEEETEPETWKVCAPKICDTDADCGGSLVCVLETYGCDDPEPLIVVDEDCAEGEDCGEGFAPPMEEEPEEEEECVEETIGHCAPKWLAPCEASEDCGPGFDCVEEEICWGWSSGSAGSSGSSGGSATPTDTDTSTDCDSDDTDCAPDEEESSAPDPSGGKESGGEPSSGEECELTGNFYCELQEIDCSSEACPEGLICVAVDSTDVAACWETSDGETNCPDGEAETEPTMACVPENFEDWIGQDAGGGVYASDSENATGKGTTDEDPDGPSSEPPAEESGGGGGGGGGGGCAGGPSDAPLSALAMALLALGLVTRRRT